jgi:hypothetical protein
LMRSTLRYESYEMYSTGNVESVKIVSKIKHIQQGQRNTGSTHNINQPIAI